MTRQHELDKIYLAKKCLTNRGAFFLYLFLSFFPWFLLALIYICLSFHSCVLASSILLLFFHSFTLHVCLSIFLSCFLAFFWLYVLSFIFFLVLSFFLSSFLSLFLPSFVSFFFCFFVCFFLSFFF